ncbi:GbsR/MarR family transcriptional regulator [Plantibacter flavus]|uniref:GbsR/MarR family transcriptional regulator n=1 Tax=Plantibacter flavus TaxID=150123 RepID=UPI003F5CEB57
MNDEARFPEWFVERFADYWQTRGASRIEGRIAGYLLVSDTTGVTADELAAALGASRGSVSTYTRRLVDSGFVRRVRQPGDRSHYFVMAADVWGGFLASEHDYLDQQRRLAEAALAHTTPGTPSHERVLNMRDYMGWIIDNRSLSSEWERFKRERDAAASPGAREH